MQTKTEINQEAVDALNLITEKGLLNAKGEFSVWIANSLNTLVSHSNPIAAANALILFYNALEQKGTLHKSAKKHANIQNIITSLVNHEDPISFIQAVLLINNNAKFLNRELIQDTIEAMLNHPFPAHFATAFLNAFHAKLLDVENESAKSNLEHLISFAELWYGNEELAVLFGNIPIHEWTQTRFDSLIEVSKTLSLDRSNLVSSRLAIAQNVANIFLDIKDQATSPRDEAVYEPGNAGFFASRSNSSETLSPARLRLNTYG